MMNLGSFSEHAAPSLDEPELPVGQLRCACPAYWLTVHTNHEQSTGISSMMRHLKTSL